MLVLLGERLNEFSIYELIIQTVDTFAYSEL
jgi:hypothetical protein